MVTLGAGEIAQLVDRFTALAEDQNMVLSTHIGELKITYSSTARESVDLFGRGYLHSHVPVRVYSRAHTHAYIYIQRTYGFKRKDVIITFGYLCICLFVCLVLSSQ